MSGGRGASDPPITYQGPYDAARTYLPRQIVTLAGVGYLSLSKQTGVSPPDPVHWLSLGGGALVGEPDTNNPNGLFIPTLTAAITDAAVWANLRASNAIRLAYLELNLLTAPTAATTTNNMALTVHDAFGASATLPMSSTARYFAYDLSAADKKVYTPNGSGGGVGEHKCFWSRFKPTADITISAVQVSCNNVLTAAGAGSSKSLEITDASGNILAETAPFTAALTSSEGNFGPVFSFLAPVTLPMSVDYYLGVRQYDIAGGAHGLQPTYQPGSPTGATVPVGLDSIRKSDTLGDVFANSTFLAGSNGTIGMNLIGSTSGLRLSGPVHVDLVVNGTGGTPGSGLNARFGWRQST